MHILKHAIMGVEIKTRVHLYRANNKIPVLKLNIQQCNVKKIIKAMEMMTIKSSFKNNFHLHVIKAINNKQI